MAGVIERVDLVDELMALALVEHVDHLGWDGVAWDLLASSLSQSPCFHAYNKRVDAAQTGQARKRDDKQQQGL